LRSVLRAEQEFTLTLDILESVLEVRRAANAEKGHNASTNEERAINAIDRLLYASNTQSQDRRIQ